MFKYETTLYQGHDAVKSKNLFFLQITKNFNKMPNAKKSILEKR